MKQICLCMLICILFIPGCCCYEETYNNEPRKAEELYLVITDTAIRIDKAECLNAKKDFTDVNARELILGARPDGPVTWLITYTNGTQDTLEVASRNPKIEYVDSDCGDPYVNIILEPTMLTWTTFSQVYVSGNLGLNRYLYSVYYDTIYAKP